MSCRSRANWWRWSARASRVISLRAATSCALRWMTWLTPHAARADTKIWKAMLPSTVQPCTCQGTMSEAATQTATAAQPTRVGSRNTAITAR